MKVAFEILEEKRDKVLDEIVDLNVKLNEKILQLRDIEQRIKLISELLEV